MVNLVYNPHNLDLAISGGDGVIKASEMAALDEAHSVLRAAEDRAIEIVQEAEAAYQREKERGYVEGRELARKQAFARALSEQAYLEHKLQELERGLADVVKTCMRKILGSFDDTALVESMTRTALQKMHEDSPLQIHLPPGLIDSFQPVAARLGSSFPKFQSIELVEDRELAAPDFVLETSTCRIECDLAHKLDALDALIDEAVAAMSSGSEQSMDRREMVE